MVISHLCSLGYKERYIVLSLLKDVSESQVSIGFWYKNGGSHVLVDLACRDCPTVSGRNLRSRSRADDSGVYVWTIVDGFGDSSIPGLPAHQKRHISVFRVTQSVLFHRLSSRTSSILLNGTLTLPVNCSTT